MLLSLGTNIIIFFHEWKNNNTIRTDKGRGDKNINTTRKDAESNIVQKDFSIMANESRKYSDIAHFIY